MPLHIVHVEDDEPLLELLKVALYSADSSINLQQFLTAEEALSYIENTELSVDLFVLDIQLPGSLSGLELAKKIREMELSGNIILCSSYSTPEQEALAAINGEYIPKPWRILDVTQHLLSYRSNSLS